MWIMFMFFIENSFSIIPHDNKFYTLVIKIAIAIYRKEEMNRYVVIANFTK